MSTKTHYIREIMQLKGVSITELAHRMGITQQAVSALITHDLRVSKAKKIAEALNVPMSVLFIEPKFHPELEEHKPQETIIECPRCGEKLQLSLTPTPSEPISKANNNI